MSQILVVPLKLIINFVFDQNHQIPLKVIDVYKLLSPRPEKADKSFKAKGRNITKDKGIVLWLLLIFYCPA